MLKFLLEKEFKQLLRGGMLPGILIMMPLMMMGLFPWAANMEMRNINVTVVDNDHSSYSSRLTGKVDASRYLHLESAAESYGAAMHRIERGSADLILEIPEHFERDITRDGMAPVMISANAVNGMKGSLGSIYASSVAMDFATEIAEENRAYATATDIPVVEVIPQNKFNPHMDYKVFMVPALMPSTTPPKSAMASRRRTSWKKRFWARVGPPARMIRSAAFTSSAAISGFRWSRTLRRGSGKPAFSKAANISPAKRSVKAKSSGSEQTKSPRAGRGMTFSSSETRPLAGFSRVWSCPTAGLLVKNAIIAKLPF